MWGNEPTKFYLLNSHQFVLARDSVIITLMQTVYDVQRFFQYDYIYFDLLFLIIWLAILFWKKEYGAILFATIISPVIYFIDAQVWWNNKVNGVYIREYWINNIQLPHPLGDFFWMKFGADFMMTISYSLFTFAWIWLAFKYIKNKSYKRLIKYTLIWFSFWIMVPVLSFVLDINNTIVHSVRHMNSQYSLWITMTVVSYIILLIIYWKNKQIIPKLFFVGVIAALIMEFPLYIFNIREMGIEILFFDAIFMINQSIPLLYLIYDKALRKLNSREGLK